MSTGAHDVLEEGNPITMVSACVHCVFAVPIIVYLHVQLQKARNVLLDREVYYNT